MKPRLAAAWTAAALWLAAPAAAQTGPLLDFSAAETVRILAHGPWPPPAVRDVSNRADGRPQAIALGRRLFFDAALSIDGRRSCASCHQPARAFQDGLAVAAGRLDGQRNTPGLFDAAGQRWFGWDGAHDSLWSASLTPLLAAGEMGASPATLAARVRRDAALARELRAVFGAPADDEAVVVSLAKALAAYQATLVSPRTPFDDFRDALARGDRDAAARYPLAAQRGLRLFVGAGRCSVCHAGPAFTNGEFADIGVPFFVPGGVDPGRYRGLQRLQASTMTRLGRWSDAGPRDPGAVGTRHVVLEHRHFGEFKVPGLRQLASTAPYMHSGSLATIEDVVQHYSALDEERLHADGERILRPLRLDEAAAADLAAFLRSLGGGAQAGASSSASSAGGVAATR